MSELTDFEMEVFLDQEKVDASILRYAREDVTASIKGYGTENVNPGFTTIIDTANISDGEHILSIKIKNKDKVVAEKKHSYQNRKVCCFSKC